MPKFSIIIPTHNAEDRIRTCLDSVKNQTYKDYELIVVCDACTDDTKVVARDYGLSWFKKAQAAFGEGTRGREIADSGVERMTEELFFLDKQ